MSPGRSPFYTFSMTCRHGAALRPPCSAEADQHLSTSTWRASDALHAANASLAATWDLATAATAPRQDHEARHVVALAATLRTNGASGALHASGAVTSRAYLSSYHVKVYVVCTPAPCAPRPERVSLRAWIGIH